MVILKEDMMFRIYVQLLQITELQGYSKSLVGLRLLLTVYLMDQIYMVKKSQWKTEILLKIDIYSEDDTSKPGSFNSLRGIFLLNCYLETDLRGESVPK